MATNAPATKSPVCWLVHFSGLHRLQRWSSPAFIGLGVAGALPPLAHKPGNLALTAHELSSILLTTRPQRMHATNSYTPGRSAQQYPAHLRLLTAYDSYPASNKFAWHVDSL